MIGGLTQRTRNAERLARCAVFAFAEALGHLVRASLHRSASVAHSALPAALSHGFGHRVLRSVGPGYETPKLHPPCHGNERGIAAGMRSPAGAKRIAGNTAATAWRACAAIWGQLLDSPPRELATCRASTPRTASVGSTQSAQAYFQRLGTISSSGSGSTRSR